jgi:hypothetical protein
MSFSDLSALLAIAFLLGGLIFNLALLWFRVKDLEEEFKNSLVEQKETNNRLNRLINKGNRKLNWDFDFYDDSKPRQ